MSVLSLNKKGCGENSREQVEKNLKCFSILQKNTMPTKLFLAPFTKSLNYFGSFARTNDCHKKKIFIHLMLISTSSFNRPIKEKLICIFSYKITT